MKTYFKITSILSISILIICVGSIYFFYLSKNNEIEVGPPEITLLETVGNVSLNPNTGVQKYLFTHGDVVWIYMEYVNVSHGGVSNFYVNVSVCHLLTGELLGFAENHITENEKARFYYFNTDESWPDGVYIVSSNLRDNISGETAFKSTDFDLI